MDNQNNNPDQQDNDPSYDMSDMEIWDLEDEETEETEQNEKKPILHSGNTIHIILLLVVIIFFGGIFLKFSKWGKFIDLKEISLWEVEEAHDILDQIMPLLSDDENQADDGVTTILAFGNHPFSDDRDSQDSLANIIAQEKDTVVYNCAVSGSCMSAQFPYFDSSLNAMDAYSFYWLVTLAVNGSNSSYYSRALKSLGDEAPPEAQEVYNTLTTIDLNTVDVVAIMYDGTDYLLGRSMYSDDNPTDITCFTGNLEAGIELLQEHYPGIRIIVMSPAYSYAVDYDGTYISSDLYTYGQDVFSTYVIKECESCVNRSVTFVDNLYGTITEDNAKDYLTDNLHLNKKGRKLIADRFLYALNYYKAEE